MVESSLSKNTSHSQVSRETTVGCWITTEYLYTLHHNRLFILVSTKALSKDKKYDHMHVLVEVVDGKEVRRKDISEHFKKLNLAGLACVKHMYSTKSNLVLVSYHQPRESYQTVTSVTVSLMGLGRDFIFLHEIVA